MVFSKIRIGILRARLRGEEAISEAKQKALKKRLTMLDKNKKEEEVLLTKRIKLIKEEERLRKAIKETRFKGLSKREKELLKRRMEMNRKKREQIKKSLIVAGKSIKGGLKELVRRLQ